MGDMLFLRAQFVDITAKRGETTPMLRVEIDLSAGSGGSGTDAVENLSVPVAKGDLVRIQGIQGFMFITSEMDPPWATLVATGFVENTRIGDLTVDATSPIRYALLFPLTPTLVYEIEGHRGGGNPQLAFAIRLDGEYQQKIQLSAQVPFNVWLPFVANRIVVYSSKGRGLPPEIPESKWVNEILPALGAGEWLLYEIPLENFEGSALADEYLRNAWNQFRTGDWKLCVAACRDVVESLKPELVAATNPVFSDTRATAPTKMRNLTGAFGDLIEALSEYQRSVQSLLAAGAHPEKPDQVIDRADAELALHLALSLRQYIGLRLKATKTPTPPAST